MTGHGRVLVGVDGSAASDAAVRWAALEASARDAELIVVHAVQSSSVGLWLTTEAIRAELREFAQPYVDGALRIARASAPDVRARGRVLVASPTRALVLISRDVDLAVVGRSGRNAMARLWYGSVTWRLFARSACPVVSVPAGCAAELISRVVLDGHAMPATATFAEAESLRLQVPCARLATDGHRPADSCRPHDLVVLGESRRPAAALRPLDRDVAGTLAAVDCVVAVVPEPPGSR